MLHQTFFTLNHIIINYVWEFNFITHHILFQIIISIHFILNLLIFVWSLSLSENFPVLQWKLLKCWEWIEKQINMRLIIKKNLDFIHEIFPHLRCYDLLSNFTSLHFDISWALLYLQFIFFNYIVALRINKNNNFFYLL